MTDDDASSIEIPGPPTFANARKHPRFNVALPVQLSYRDRTYDVTSVNVSAGGMLLSMQDPPPPGERMALKLHLGEEQVLEITATVVHLGADLGVGIRFDRVDDFATELQELEAFLAKLT